MERQFQHAKNHFSKVIESARTHGPQFVTFSGERAAVVLSARDYDALTAAWPNIVDHLLSGPPWDRELAEAIERRAKTQNRDAVFLTDIVDTDVVSEARRGSLEAAWLRSANWAVGIPCQNPPRIAMLRQ